MSYQSSKSFTHSQRVIATITKAESQSTRSGLSAVKAEITTERFPRALVLAPADGILVTREPVWVGPRGRWTAAVVAAARVIDDRTDAATLFLIHPIGMAPIGHCSRKWWRSDAECGKKSAELCAFRIYSAGGPMVDYAVTVPQVTQCDRYPSRTGCNGWTRCCACSTMAHTWRSGPWI
jgi:hypothetical protein